MPTGVADGLDVVLARIVALIERMRRAVPQTGTLLGVGVGSPGPLDPESGVIFSAPNMAGWRNVPLRATLAAQTGLPVVIGNDANAAALAEWLFGGGTGYRHLVYLTISTGIGCGAIVDGRLVLGRLGAAAELGHTLIAVDGAVPTVWENLASGTAMARIAAQAMHAHPHSHLHALATPATVRAADVIAAAAAGDELARELVQRQVQVLGVGLVNALHLFSPAIVLVGGGVIVHNPWLLAQASDVARGLVLDELYRSVPIEVAHLGEQVGLLGAAALLLYRSGLLP
jgi:glucokinase